MNVIDPDEEQSNILEVLATNPELQLLEIHRELVEMDESAFAHCPERGNTWNDERHILRALKDILERKKSAITNERGSNYQRWSLTEQGERILNG